MRNLPSVITPSGLEPRYCLIVVVFGTWTKKCDTIVQWQHLHCIQCQTFSKEKNERLSVHTQVAATSIGTFGVGEFFFVFFHIIQYRDISINQHDQCGT